MKKEDEALEPGLFRPFSRRFWLRILALFGIAAAAGSLSGYLLTIDIPQVSRLEDYRPPIGTKIYSDLGEVLYEFAGQKRILIRYEQIPEVLRTAIIATEDSRFYHHFGIDPRSILRAVIKDVLSLRFAQGASTITQQLARNLFLRPDKTVWRKVQEAVLALQIEKAYTKEEILEFYCNQIYMGHGRYGLEAASRLYHGKHAADLTLAEAALLAGILQRPEALSPFRHRERALRKRDHVLNRMVKEGYLSREDFEIHSKEPLVLPEPQETKNIAPYFVERIRQDLEKRYGGEAIYGEGMEVYSTLNLEMQAAANEAVLKGLRALDKRQGYRGPIRNLLEEDGETSLDEYEDAAWEEEVETGSILPGLVTKVSAAGADIRIGKYHGQVSRDGFGWTKEKDPQDLFHIGDLAWFLVEKIDREKGLVDLSLEQIPDVEGALIALDPATGKIKAMVGGYSFQRSQFNRAVQSRRQSGSAFKPILYASALEAGYRATDTFEDEPTVFLQEGSSPPYQPENFLRKYFGRTTLREALEESRNIISVKLLFHVGLEKVIDMARRMGIESRLYSVPSLALGASEVTLKELTSAYGIFPNQGILVEPYSIDYVVGGNGRILEEANPRIREVIRSDLAFVMNHILEGVIENGTGKNARILDTPMGGKTGTTDDFTDAWFIGFTPSLAVGVWVGFDQKLTLGKNETGARAALPIWIDFFRKVLAGKPEEDFHRPPNVVLVPIDRKTGLRASVDSGCSDIFLEAFVRGTEPAAYCSREEHLRQNLPYYLQEFSIGKDNNLVISSTDLFDLLARYPHDLAMINSGRALTARVPGQGEISIILSLTRKERQEILTRLSLANLSPEDPFPFEFWEWAEEGSFVGLDGRPAEVLDFNAGS